MSRIYQYSAKLDDIHLHLDGESATVCGRPMLANNYLGLSKSWTEDDRKGLLRLHPRIICESCLTKLSLISEV